MSGQSVNLLPLFVVLPLVAIATLMQVRRSRIAHAT